MTIHRRSVRVPVAAVAGALLALSACSTQGETSRTAATSSSASSASGTGQGYPVTVTSCGKPVTFDRAPERAVSNDINMFESMAALGLQNRMVGTFGIQRSGSDGARSVPPEYHEAYSSVKSASQDYIALEPLVGLKPDFLFAGWNYGLKAGSTMTPDNLEKYGIKTLALTESCAHVEKSKRAASINDTYTDLTNLGAIFDVPEKAGELIGTMKRTVAEVQKQVAGREPVSVFLYDSGTDSPFTAPGLAIPDNLIALAGGKNIFHDLRETWTSVSWETVVEANPACIIINDYGTPSYEQKKQFLKTNPTTKNLPAVKRDCFVRLGYDSLTPGPRNADAVRTIAKALHPDAVK